MLDLTICTDPLLEPHQPTASQKCGTITPQASGAFTSQCIKWRHTRPRTETLQPTTLCWASSITTFQHFSSTQTVCQHPEKDTPTQSAKVPSVHAPYALDTVYSVPEVQCLMLAFQRSGSHVQAATCIRDRFADVIESAPNHNFLSKHRIATARLKTRRQCVTSESATRQDKVTTAIRPATARHDQASRAPSVTRPRDARPVNIPPFSVG